MLKKWTVMGYSKGRYKILIPDSLTSDRVQTALFTHGCKWLYSENNRIILKAESILVNEGIMYVIPFGEFGSTIATDISWLNVLRNKPIKNIDDYAIF